MNTMTNVQTLVIGALVLAVTALSYSNYMAVAQNHALSLQIKAMQTQLNNVNLSAETTAARVEKLEHKLEPRYQDLAANLSK